MTFPGPISTQKQREISKNMNWSNFRRCVLTSSYCQKSRRKFLYADIWSESMCMCFVYANVNVKVSVNVNVNVNVHVNVHVHVYVHIHVHVLVHVHEHVHSSTMEEPYQKHK